MRGWLALVLVAALSGCLQVQVGAPPQAAAPDKAGASIAFGPAEPRAGQAVTFQGTVRSPAEGDSLRSVTWSFGDGTSATGLKTTHAYRTAGAYVVRLSAETALSGPLSASREIVVSPAVASPRPVSGGGVAPPTMARLDPPELSVAVDRNVASFSFALSGTPDQIVWDFGDGATSNETAPTHTYLSKGDFTVRLRIAVGAAIAENTTVASIAEVPFQAHVIVGVTDSGINPYHSVYHRPAATAHPCTYVEGYDCSVPALNLSVGPGLGSYQSRLQADAAEWEKVRPGKWFWIPRTNIIAVHCPDGGSTQGGRCILDDESSHGTGTTSSVLTEAPDALIVFNDGSDSSRLAHAPVAIDIESNSWGSLAPLYGGLVNGPTGAQVCHDDVDAPTAVKFRSAGNNGPVPNLGDCWRNGHRTYSVSGGYPDGSHGQMSGSAPDFASYWCRPVATAGTLDEWGDSCGTSFAAPTAAGTAAATLLAIRREMGHTGGSTATEVAPGLAHEAFVDAIVWAATYEPEARGGFPEGSLVAPATSATPWYWWGWGWLDSQVAGQAVECAMGRTCPDNKPPEAWAFNDVRRSFASDGSPL